MSGEQASALHREPDKHLNRTNLDNWKVPCLLSLTEGLRRSKVSIDCYLLQDVRAGRVNRRIMVIAKEKGTSGKEQESAAPVKISSGTGGFIRDQSILARL